MSGEPGVEALRRIGPDGHTVAQVMSTNLLCCTPDTSIAEAARRMRSSGHGAIVVCAAERAVGYWTEQDALAQAIAGTDPSLTPVSRVMNAPVPCLSSHVTLGEATMHFKREGVEQYLVVDESERPCGLLVRHDLVANHGVEWFMRLHTVRDALDRAAPIAGPGVRAGEAMRMMHHNGWEAMVVRAPDGTTAIATSRDLLGAMEDGSLGVPAYRFAGSRLPTIGIDDSLVRARNVLRETGARQLGALDTEGQLAGLVGSREILMTLDRGYVEDLEMALAQRDDALRTSVERYRSLVERSPDAIAVHCDQRILFINPAGARLLGAQAPGFVMGRSLAEFLVDSEDDELSAAERSAFLERETGSAPREERIRRLDRREIDVEMSTLEIAYADDTAWQVVMRDITRRKELERELRVAAVTDQQTGIYNRQYFFEHVEQAIREVDRYGGDLCLLMFDLDRFKQINDELGHDRGDQVLLGVVEKVSQKLRDTDVFARWGGEEFMVLAPGIDRTGGERLADKLRASIAAIETDPERRVTASFGVAVYRQGEQWRRFLKRVDNAMYAAKEAGRDCIRFAD